MVSLKQLYTWFATGKFPTEAQFAEQFKSFWHKSERLPLEQIFGLQEEISNVSTKFKGYHSTLAELQTAYPQSENIKDFYAFVGSPYPGTVYKVYENSGVWSDTGEIPTQQEIDLTEYAKIATSEGLVVRTENGKVIKVIEPNNTITDDGEYLMLDDGEVDVNVSGSTSIISVPESELTVSGYINSDGSLLAGANYKRTDMKDIPNGAISIEVYSFDSGSSARPIAFYTDKGVFISTPSNVGFNTPTIAIVPPNATKYALCKHISYSYKCEITISPTITLSNNNALIRIIKDGNLVTKDILRDLSTLSTGLKVVTAGETVTEDGSYLMFSDGNISLPKYIEEIPMSEVSLVGALMPDGTTNTSNVYYHSPKISLTDDVVGFRVSSFDAVVGGRALAQYTDTSFISTASNVGFDKIIDVERASTTTQVAFCRNTGYSYYGGIIKENTIYFNKDAIILIEVKNGVASITKLHDFSNVESKIPNRLKAGLKDCLLDNTAITSNTVNIVGTSAVNAMQLKYKAYMSAENLTFSVVFKANANSSIRIGRHLGGCMKVDGNALTVYRLNSNLSDYEVHETFTLPFSITAGQSYTVSCDKIDLFNLRYSISASTGESFSVIYNKKEVEASKRTVAIAWGTPFFGVINGDVTVNNAMLLARYDFNTLISIFGDSFIEGTSLIDMGLENKWSTQLANNIGKQFVHISGKGGELADANFVARFKVENSLFKSPYVILALGTNHSNLSSYTTYMQQLIDECRTNNQIPILQTIPPRQGVNYTTVTKAINDWVKASGELFIDFHAVLTTGDGSVWISEFVLPDGVHPSVAGHNAKTEQVMRYLIYLNAV